MATNTATLPPARRALEICPAPCTCRDRYATPRARVLRGRAHVAAAVAHTVQGLQQGTHQRPHRHAGTEHR